MGIVRYFIALFALFSLSATVASAKTPLLGYVVKGELLRQHSELVEGLAKASLAAKPDLLLMDEPFVTHSEMEAARILRPGGPREVPGEGTRQRV